MVEGDEPKKEGLFLDGQLFPFLSFIAALSYILCLSWRREGMRGEGRDMTRTHHVGFRMSRCTGWSDWICPNKLRHYSNLYAKKPKRWSSMPQCMLLHPVMSTERGAAERGPPARKVSLGALKVSSSFLPSLLSLGDSLRSRSCSLFGSSCCCTRAHSLRFPKDSH